MRGWLFMSNLWWFHTSAERCSFSELKRRKALAFGWSEFGDISRIIKDKPGWERQFKTYIQVKGDVVYHGDSKWRDGDRNFDQVPSIFWQLLEIKQDDLVAVIESGNQLTYGRPVVRGVGQFKQDAIKSYNFDENAKHGHSVGENIQWLDWDAAHMGELQPPKGTFRVICQNNDGLELALQALHQAEVA
jgi:hypothetical protein